MIKVTHTLLYRSHPLISLAEYQRGWGGGSMHRAPVSIDVFIVSCLRRCPGSLRLAVTVRGQHSNQSFPLEAV